MQSGQGNWWGVFVKRLLNEFIFYRLWDLQVLGHYNP